MRTWVLVLAGVGALVAAACGGSEGSAPRAGAGGEPVSLGGETEQGLRLRIDRIGDRAVRLRFPADCGRDDRPADEATSLHRHRIETEVDGDGRFSVDESYEEDGTDGDEEHVEVRIQGAFAEDGTATGTLEVTTRWWNGQGREFSDDCESGSVGWTADQPPVEGDDLGVPLTDPVWLAPAGADVVVTSESGAVVRVDAATGEARALGDGAPTEGDPNVPTTVVAGAAAPPATAPVWMRDVAAVAGGVWMVDPATGAVSRFELADGARTATIDQPLDDMAAGPDALWTVSTNVFKTGYALERRDPVSGAVLASTPVQRGRVIVAPTGVWYADSTWDGGRLSPVDPATLAIGPPFDVDIALSGEDPVGTNDRIWWLDVEQRLTSIEMAGGRTATVDLPSEPDAVAGDTTGVWTVHEQEAVARRVEGGRVVRTVDVPDGFWNVAVTADGAVWLAGRGAEAKEPRVVRLDPAVTTG